MGNGISDSTLTSKLVTELVRKVEISLNNQAYAKSAEKLRNDMSDAKVNHKRNRKK